MDWDYVLSRRTQNLPPSTIGKLLKIANEQKEIISLGPGEPDFDSPDYIIDAAKKSLDDRETHYSPISGRSDLKESIIKKLGRINGIDASAENITIGNGSTDCLFNALTCLVDNNSDVLLPDPGFLAYKPSVMLLGGEPIPIPLLEENNFEFTAEGIKESLKNPAVTKAIVINSPSNPTGTVLSKKSLEEIAEVAIDNDIMIMSDEAYERFVYDDAKHVSVASLNGMEDHVVSFFTFSKTYAMPGFRVGYAVGPEKLIEMMDHVHTFTSLTAGTSSQIAAKAALDNEKEGEMEIEKMRQSYDERRKFVLKRLREINGFTVQDPKGAFYMFPRAEFGMKSYDLSNWLIDNAKVATVPGTEFGEHGEGFLRLSYATDIKLIEEALDRIEQAVKELN